MSKLAKMRHAKKQDIKAKQKLNKKKKTINAEDNAQIKKECDTIGFGRGEKAMYEIKPI